MTRVTNVRDSKHRRKDGEMRPPETRIGSKNAASARNYASRSLSGQQSFPDGTALPNSDNHNDPIVQIGKGRVSKSLTRLRFFPEFGQVFVPDRNDRIVERFAKTGPGWQRLFQNANGIRSSAHKKSHPLRMALILIRSIDRLRF